MAEKRWINAGATNGLWYRVTNGEKIIEVARLESADELCDILNALERDAAFGRQCIQDDCEGAWIAASVHKKLAAEVLPRFIELHRFYRNAQGDHLCKDFRDCEQLLRDAAHPGE